MRGRMFLILTLAALLIAPSIAAADVLVSRPQPSIRCGESIRTGVWYRDFPDRGARSATIVIRSASGAVVWRRKVIARSSWRYFRFRPSCGQRYRVRYETAAGATTFRVSVRRR